MRTVVNCPRCQNQFPAEVFQLIDVGQQPELKQLVLSGQLNVAQCPNCGASFPVLTPLVYHDPEHELFMVHIPMELDMPVQQREQTVGRLIQQVMNSLPPEQRKGYLLQPEEILTQKTFMEKILATEGITPEMIERQQNQAELVQKLAGADREVTDILLEENEDLIDEAFFALLGQFLEAASARGDSELELKLLNLQARLYQETEAGQRLEKRQAALRRFQKEAQKEGLTPELFLKHLKANLGDEMVVDNIIMMGQQALSYELFSLLSDEIEKKEKMGGDTTAAPLKQLREKLLEIYETLQQQSQELMNRAGATLQGILEAEDRRAAIRERMEEIDDAFMYVLSANMQQLEQRGQSQQAQILRDVHELIMDEMESQAPPEVRLLNQLIRAEDRETRRQILENNRDAVTPQLKQVIQAVMGDAQSAGQEKLVAHLGEVLDLIDEMGVGSGESPSILTP